MGGAGVVEVGGMDMAADERRTERICPLCQEKDGDWHIVGTCRELGEKAKFKRKIEKLELVTLAKG